MFSDEFSPNTEFPLKVTSAPETKTCVSVPAFRLPVITELTESLFVILKELPSAPFPALSRTISP